MPLISYVILTVIRFNLKLVRSYWVHTDAYRVSSSTGLSGSCLTIKGDDSLWIDGVQVHSG